VRLLDLFSGIGGFSLAAQWVWGDELEIVAFCEIDKFCQKVLKKHWPDVPIIEDVRDVKVIQKSINPIDGRTETKGGQTINGNLGTTSNFRNIDLLTGGFPCQPFSVAGKRKGKEDNRFLWPEMFRIIKEIRPRWVVAENVAGIVRMALDDCLSDLEGEGYSTQAVIIPACAVNAPHRRDRVWIVAYTQGRESREQETGDGRKSLIGAGQDVADNAKSGLSESRFAGKWKQGTERTGGLDNRLSFSNWWSTESDVGRIIYGLPTGLDGHLWTNGWEDGVSRVTKAIPNRVDRLKALGNSIVWWVVVPILQAIKEIEGGNMPNL
jgi:DNA (cytosine-5)-methyltransferase 1